MFFFCSTGDDIDVVEPNWCLVSKSSISFLLEDRWYVCWTVKSLQELVVAVIFPSVTANLQCLWFLVLVSFVRRHNRDLSRISRLGRGHFLVIRWIFGLVFLPYLAYAVFFSRSCRLVHGHLEQFLLSCHSLPFIPRKLGDTEQSSSIVSSLSRSPDFNNRSSSFFTSF